MCLVVLCLYTKTFYTFPSPFALPAFSPHTPPQSGDTTTSISNTSSPLSSIIVPTAANPSSAAIIDLVKEIFLPEPVEGITDDQFLDEQHVFEVVAAYLPDDATNTGKLAEWMAKDGTWGSTKRKRVAQGRISGRLYHVVQEAYRDYRWDDLSNVHQFRRHIRLTSDKIFLTSDTSDEATLTTRLSPKCGQWTCKLSS